MQADHTPEIVFWCESCDRRCLVEQPPSALIDKVACPMCGAAVKFRQPRTVVRSKDPRLTVATRVPLDAVARAHHGRPVP